MCRLFPCITIFLVFFFFFVIKNCKKIYKCGGVMNRIVTCEKCIISCKKGYK